MRRFIRLALLGALVGIVGIGTALPAESANLPTWTWVVSCADPDGVSTTETLGTTLPSGTYLVTVEGACVHTAPGSRDLNVGTPCSAPLVGTIPCATLTTVHNVPGTACPLATTAQVWTEPCTPSVTLGTCATFTVVVNGQCLVTGTAGLVTHAGGGMNARFIDGFYSDNTGYFVVTAVLTPL